MEKNTTDKKNDHLRNLLIKIYNALMKESPILLGTIGGLFKMELQNVRMKLKNFVLMFPSMFQLSLNTKRAEILSLLIYPTSLKDWTMCPDFILSGSCAKNTACAYLHGENDSRLTATPQAKAVEEKKLVNNSSATNEQLGIIYGFGDFLIEPRIESVAEYFEDGKVPTWIQQRLTSLAKQMFKLVSSNGKVLLRTMESQFGEDLKQISGVSLTDIIQQYSLVFKLSKNEFREEIVSLKTYVDDKSSYPWKMCLNYIIDGECIDEGFCKFKHSSLDQRSMPHKPVSNDELLATNPAAMPGVFEVRPHNTSNLEIDNTSLLLDNRPPKERKLLRRIKAFMRAHHNQALLSSVTTSKIENSLARLQTSLKDFLSYFPEFKICLNENNEELLVMELSTKVKKKEIQLAEHLHDVVLHDKADGPLLAWLIETLRYKMNSGILSEIESYKKCQKHLKSLKVTLREFILRYPSKLQIQQNRANIDVVILKEDYQPLFRRIRQMLKLAKNNQLFLTDIDSDGACRLELAKTSVQSIKDFVGYFPFLFKLTKDESGIDIIQLKKKNKGPIKTDSQSVVPKSFTTQVKKVDSIVTTTNNNIALQDAIQGEFNIKWVRTLSEVQQVQAHLSTTSIVAVDAEYQNETIYLVQLFAGNVIYLFDFYVDHSDRLELIQCLRYLMQNINITKVFHDSRQDVYQLNKLGIDNIASLVDTQVLYQMNQELKKSQEKRIGLGPLLRMYGYDHKLKEQVHREMEEGKIDWSKRPLDERLIKYAAEDVSYLIQLYQKLEEERQQLTQEIYKAYSTSLTKTKDLTIQKQTYLERAAVKPNEKYQLVFSSDMKANYYTETINNTNIKGHNPNNTNHRNNDEFDELIETLPPNIQAEVTRIIQSEDKQVIEIIVDYAKPVCLRFEDRSEKNIQITANNLEAFITNLRDKTNTDFRRDNRMGMEGTLHRISVIKNKDDKPVGLTYRIGRHIMNSCALIEDLIHAIIASQQMVASSPMSLLLLGPPGVGKTTLLREISARLSDVLGRSVMIIDTSNEIGGDGDAPHICIGNSRRMQVPDTKGQHDIMLEAIKNHNPSVIVIDEIGTLAEAKAAKTIGQRGVQLIATAHGMTLDSLMKNPELVSLIGGIQPVFIGDRDAVRKEDGTKEKIILQRAGDPTFNIIIEMHKKDQWRIYNNVAHVIDAKLARKPYISELRWIDGGDDKLMAMIETHNDEKVTGGSLHWLDMYKH